jgi:hypothetical protein
VVGCTMDYKKNPSTFYRKRLCFDYLNSLLTIRSICDTQLTIPMDTKALIIVLFVSTTIATASFAKTLLAQVLERDVDAPTNLINGTTVPGGISIDIDPTETLPTNGNCHNVF